MGEGKKGEGRDDEGGREGGREAKGGGWEEGEKRGLGNGGRKRYKRRGREEKLVTQIREGASKGEKEKEREGVRNNEEREKSNNQRAALTNNFTN